MTTRTITVEALADALQTAGLLDASDDAIAAAKDIFAALPAEPAPHEHDWRVLARYPDDEEMPEGRSCFICGTAEPAGAGLDADRLTAIIESRMSRDLAWLRDDGKTVDRFGPEQVAWALAHLYLTGDIVSGLPALAATPVGEDT